MESTFMTPDTGAAGTLPARACVLVVEDTREIAELVTTALRFDGHDVHQAGDGRSALLAARRLQPDLVVLDVMLPGLDGFAVQRELAAADNPPAVLMLTAREGVADKVRGLDQGAEDYVTKPFSLEELLARVRGILRRRELALAKAEDAAASAAAEAGGPGPAGGSGGGRTLTYHDLTLDEDTRDVSRAGARVELTPREFDLLRYLLENAGRVVTKAQILDAVWEYDFGGEANIVETYVSYLRRKLDTTEPRLFHTVRGVGYTLRVQPER
jgi:two-component system OmpR family response regulator